MVVRKLVTTAIEETWPEKGSILFLGEWCKWEQRRSVWNNMDTQTLAWHWDDKEIFIKNTHNINIFYEKILEILSDILNTQHSVSYSKKYWRILLNPWLFRIVFALFDRWSCIINAYKYYNITETNCLEVNGACMIPQHSLDFK